jgi:hypothetical protein
MNEKPVTQSVKPFKELKEKDVTSLQYFKELLESEETIQDLYHNGVDLENFDMSLSVFPILAVKDKVILQFHGWVVFLNKDGTWSWKPIKEE